jgi:DNA-binding MarR family transcriptional regulator
MLTNTSLADRLRVSVGRLARRLRQQSLGGLTPSQSSVLANLDRLGPLTMTQIAEQEGIAKPSATGIVGRLVNKGLIDRAIDPSDRRSSVVAINRAGSDLLDLRRQERTAFLTRRIEGLTLEERETLERAVEILERMAEER